MEELTLQVQRDERSGSRGMVGRIQVERAASRRKGKTCAILQQQITEAVATHFDEGAAPRRIRIHFVSDPILVQA
jgi:hypothetical protein